MLREAPLRRGGVTTRRINNMNLAIIGAGNIGGTLGRLWVRAGHRVIFGVRQPQALRGLLAELGGSARAGTAVEAARSAETVVFAAPYAAWPEFARAALDALKDKTVVDAANPYAARDGKIVDAVSHRGHGAGSYTAHLLPGAHVVKAFNSVYWVDLREQAHRDGERLAMPLAGDHEGACGVAAQLANDAGFDPVWVGGLARSAALDPGSAIYAKSMTAAQVRAALHLET
jgi:8-hydroxy-5-deazaflavin:NADPH oxidoreductase